MLQVRRPRSRTLRLTLNVVLMLSVSAYFLYTYQSSALTYDIVCGVIFGIWGLFVLWNLITRPVVFQETADGFKGWNVIRKFDVTWDQLVAMAPPGEAPRIVFFAYRTSAEDKDRYIGISRKALGDAGTAQVIDLVNAKRPDIPAFADGKVQDYAVRDAP